jgi:hypothetical protein
MKDINKKILAGLFIATIFTVLLSSCNSNRHLNKTNSSSDSTSLKKSLNIKKDSNAATFESKSITKTNDTAISTPDSLKGNFTFNPKDTGCVNISGETGTLDLNIKFNPSTGKGSYSTKKKQEKIPVNTYHEETKKLSLTGSTLSIKSNVDSVVVSKKANAKKVDSMFDWGGLKFLFLILLILAAAIIYYEWKSKNSIW